MTDTTTSNAQAQAVADVVTVGFIRRYALGEGGWVSLPGMPVTVDAETVALERGDEPVFLNVGDDATVTDVASAAQAAGAVLKHNYWQIRNNFRAYVSGETYAHREELKRLGFQWDSFSRSWTMNGVTSEAARRIVAAVEAAARLDGVTIRIEMR